MQYSQPYGTPAPPPGTFPRYVNGNPVTGTEGSIPPATAFDEDQIEIVNVIQNAGLTPDHTDLTQLWQAIQALLAKQYITTPITKTVHGANADFNDLIDALAWVAMFTITSTGSVTFLVHAGQWTYTQTLNLDHPQAHRISIQGAPLLGGTPQPGNISVTGYFQAGDGGNQITYLRSVHATELLFTGGVNGFLAQRAGTMLRYLLISGSQTIAPPINNINQGNGIYMTADVALDGCSFWGFGARGIYCSDATIRLPTSLSLTICFCGSGGSGGCLLIAAGSISQTQGAYTILASGCVDGITAYGSVCIFGIFCSKGHNPPSGNAGIQVLQGSHISCQPGSLVQMTNNSGVIVAGAGDWLANNCTYSNIGGWAINAYGRCTAWTDNSTFSNVGSGSIICRQGYVECIGASLASGSGGQTSPPVNTRPDQSGGEASGGYIAH